MKIHKRIINTVFAVICLLLVIPILVYGFPFVVGADRSYTVMSGSMSPMLYPGDLVIVKKIKSEEVKVGDVLTVRSEESVYTHRVVEKLEGEAYFFRLKGDANEESDLRLIESSQIIGRVILVFPFNHLYTQYGFALALIAPAFLIIGKQVHNVYQFTRRRNRRETMRWRRKSHSVLDTSTLLLALILTVSTTRVIAPHFIAGSSSYFSDTEWSTGFFRTGIWHVNALVDIKPDTLNLDSKGKWVKVNATIETDYDANDIDLSTVRLDGDIPAEGSKVKDSQLIVKFGRDSLIKHLIEKGCEDGDEVELIVSGKFNDGVSFSGVDTIVIKRSNG